MGGVARSVGLVQRGEGERVVNDRHVGRLDGVDLLKLGPVRPSRVGQPAARNAQARPIRRECHDMTLAVAES
eukprot:987208-Pleurochrysis_carterae.AAC.1